MANVKITDLTALSATDSVDTDVFVVVDVSADQTKKMTLAEAVTAFSGDVETRRVANVTEQTAIEARRAANVVGAISTVLTGDLTASRAMVTNGAGKIAISAVTATELGHLDGVSDAIQTQLDAKSSTSNAADLAAGIASSSPAVTAANILHTTSTANSYATGGATSDIDKVLVYLSGVYQGENNYVLGNSTHNVQFKDATLASGLELEIRKF